MHCLCKGDFFLMQRKRNMGSLGFVFEMFIFKNLIIIILFVGDALNNYSLDIYFSLFYFDVRNEALRVAFIDEVETLKDGKALKEFYSKLVKADINGKDKVRLPVLLSFNVGTS